MAGLHEGKGGLVDAFSGEGAATAGKLVVIGGTRDHEGIAAHAENRLRGRIGVVPSHLSPQVSNVFLFLWPWDMCIP